MNEMQINKLLTTLTGIQRSLEGIRKSIEHVNITKNRISDGVENDASLNSIVETLMKESTASQDGE